jgi:hypothetical protein
VPQTLRFIAVMRTDLLIAIMLSAVFAVLAVSAFVMEWGFVAVGVFIAATLAADAWLVLGLVGQSKKPPVP